MKNKRPVILIMAFAFVLLAGLWWSAAQHRNNNPGGAEQKPRLAEKIQNAVTQEPKKGEPAQMTVKGMTNNPGAPAQSRIPGIHPVNPQVNYSSKQASYGQDVMTREYFPNAEVVEEQIKRGENNQTIKSQILKTDFKYPLVRVNAYYESDANGEEKLVKRIASVADHVVVKFKGSEAAASVALAAQGLHVRKKMSFENLYIIEVPDRSISGIDSFAAQLNAMPEISYAEADHLLTLFSSIYLQDAEIPELTTTQRSLNWGFLNVGQSGGEIGADVKLWTAQLFGTTASQYFAMIYGGFKAFISSEVTVAVIDTGIAYDHSDLTDVMWVNSGETNPTNNVDDDGNGLIDDYYGWDFYENSSEVYDRAGHGTHCSGVIAADGGTNHNGYVGMCPSARIMAVKNFGITSNGVEGTTSDAVEAIGYAIRNGANVISASWGGLTSDNGLYEAIQVAGNSNILFIAAAGNGAITATNAPMYPAAFDLPNIISVAASDCNDELAEFSNYDPQSVDIAAPGVSILSTYPGNIYAYMDGTSMAAPHVAGAVALMKSWYPDMTTDRIRRAILESADKIDALAGKVATGGRLNVDAMVRYYPAWWHGRDVVDYSVPENNEAPANLGQAKHMTQQAIEELNTYFTNGVGITDGAGFTLEDLLDPSVPTNSFSNRALVNVGQLKNLSYRFFDRFRTEGYNLKYITPVHTNGYYPWVQDQTNLNYSIGQIGQLKALFHWDLLNFKTDGDGLDDAWEYLYFGTLGYNEADDEDGDGLTNSEEAAGGYNPMLNDLIWDKDGDHYPDVFEIRNGSDPTNSADKPAATFTVNYLGTADFTSIQEAVDAVKARGANGNFSIIEVAPGIYPPFKLESDLKLLILAPQGPFKTKISGGSQERGLFIRSDSIIDGFTFCDGAYANGSAIWCESSKATFRGCVVENNLYGVYGAVTASGGEPLFENCLFRNNVSAIGGGLVIAESANARINHCTFYNNTATAGMNAGNQIYINDPNSCLRINNSILYRVDPTLAGDVRGYIGQLSANHTLFQEATLGGSGISIQQFGESNLSGSDKGINQSGFLTESSTNLIEGGLNGEVHLDIQGESRPFPIGGQVDIGADEYIDSDLDGMPDWWEVSTFGNLNQSANTDYDNDGVKDVDEFRLGSDPKNTDTDGDGILDGEEVLYGLNILENDAFTDPDGDRYPTVFEIRHGSSYTNALSVPSASFTVNSNNSIQAALDAYRGNTNFPIIKVSPGVYQERLSISSVSPLLLIGDDANSTVIDAANSGRAIYVGSSAVLDGFTVQGGASAHGAGLFIQGEEVQVKNCIIRDHNTPAGFGSLFMMNTRALFENCIIANNQAGAGGAFFVHDANVTMNHCTVYKNKAVLGEHAGNSLYINSPKSTVTLKNSFIWSGIDNQAGELRGYLLPVKIEHSYVRDDGVFAFGDIKSVLITDPKLTPDGYITYNSPLIGLVTNASLLTDIQLESRGLDRIADLGADEFIDTDGDTLPDWWETRNFGNLSQTATNDFDSDGISNADEFKSGFNAAAADSDGDGIKDGDELALGLNPLAKDSMGDADGDRYPDVFEYAHGSSATNSSSIPAATYTVATNGGDYTTIQAAIDAAASNYCIIKVMPGIYPPFAITNKPGAAIKFLLVASGGAASTVIDAGGKNRAVFVHSDSVLDGFTLSGGAGFNGAALYVYDSEAQVKRCVIEDNNNPYGWGTILVDHGVLSLERCLVRDNVAGVGGAAFVQDGTIQCNQTTVYNNEAVMGANAGNGFYLNTTLSVLAISNSVIWNEKQNPAGEIRGWLASVAVDYSVVRGGYPGQGNLSLSNPGLNADGFLQYDSPLCNALTNPGPGKDIHLETVTDNQPDIGADEFVDTDADHLPDWWELKQFGNLTLAGTTTDKDGDGVTDANEYYSGTDPNSRDTDNDGMTDSAELTYKLNPRVDDAYDDADGDRYPNVFEIMLGANPTNSASIPSCTYQVATNVGGSYTTIQTAVNAFTNNRPAYAIINVLPGAYSPVSVNSTNHLLLISSQGAKATSIRGDQATFTRSLTIQGGGACVVEGFKITDGINYPPYMNWEKGSAVYITNVSAKISRCIISGNNAPWMIGSVYANNARLICENSLFINNDTYAGGAVAAEASSVKINYCTLYGNNAHAIGSGIFIFSPGELFEIRNSVLWNKNENGAAEIGVNNLNYLLNVYLSHNLIRNNSYVGDVILRPSDAKLTADGRLLGTSPARDAALPGSVSSDIDLESRPDVTGGLPDMGCDEYVDRDADQMPDQWEIQYFGSTNQQQYTENDYKEMRAGTDPKLNDTDGDGMSDLVEIQYGFNPLLNDAYADADGDRYPNIYEIMRGTDPTNTNSKPSYTYQVSGGGAYPTIQSAINALNSSGTDYSIIQVVPGTYASGGTLAKVDILSSKKFLLISRDGAEGVNGGGQTIISGSGSKAIHCAGANVVIDGFIIKSAGGANNGAALYADASTVFVKNSRFTQNNGTGWGTIFLNGTTGVFENCIIDTNSALYGGGVFVNGNTDMIFSHCTIYNNAASTTNRGNNIFINSTSANVSLFNTIAWEKKNNKGRSIGIGVLNRLKLVASLISDTDLIGPGVLWVTNTAPVDINGLLVSGSPAIERAETTGILLDYRFRLRPFGLKADIGADEFVDTAEAPDNLDNYWEMKYFTNLNQTASSDYDGDGLTDGEEYARGTNPTVKDSDGGGMTDGEEVANGFNPLVADGLNDADGDRYPNVFEIRHGSCPTNRASIPTIGISTNAIVTVNLAGGSDFTSIQAAVGGVTAAKASYPIIRVKPGTYSGVSLSYTNFPILLISEEGSRVTTIRSTGSGSPLTVKSPAVVDGFSIIDGKGDITYGAAVSIEGYKACLRRCTVKNNSSSAALGTIAIRGADAVVENCMIKDNSVGSGGAFYIDGSTAEILNCTLLRNKVGAKGSSLYVRDPSSQVNIQSTILWSDAANAPNEISGSQEGLTIWDSLVTTNSSFASTNNNIATADPGLTVDGFLMYGSSAIVTNIPFKAGMDIQLEAYSTNSAPDIGADEFISLDGDTLPDWWEIIYSGSVTNWSDTTDADGDGASAVEEYRWSCDPTKKDTDGNGIEDGPQIHAALNLDEMFLDADGDRYPNIFEVARNTSHTNALMFPAPDYTVQTNGLGDFTDIQSAIDQVVQKGLNFAIIAVGEGNYSPVSIDIIRPILLIATSGPEKTRIHGADNTRALYIRGGAVLDGFTITGSDIGQGTMLQKGGAVYVESSSPLLKNCIIRDNVNRRGDGTVYIDEGTPVFENCIIRNNAAFRGGGLFVKTGGFKADHCTIINNVALAGNIETDSGQAYGNAGNGIYNEDNGGMIGIVNSIVCNTQNVTDYDHGNISGYRQNILTISHSLLSDTNGITGEGNVQTGNPGLTRSGYLLYNSPAINQAISGAVRYDINFESRTNDVAPDIGADEWVDKDNDSLPDWWENAYLGGTNSNGNANSDGDSLNNSSEYTLGSNPSLADTDGDGISDADEAEYGTNPEVNDAGKSAGLDRYQYDPLRLNHAFNIMQNSSTRYRYDAEGNIEKVTTP